MAEELRIDFDRLQATGAQLTSIDHALSGTVGMSTTMADHTGHAALGAALVYFAEKWNIHREDMIDAVSALKKSLDKIHTEFHDTDTKLAGALDGSQTPPGAGGGGGGGGR